MFRLVLAVQQIRLAAFRCSRRLWRKVAGVVVVLQVLRQMAVRVVAVKV
jgi:hypothetical protein